MFDVQAAKAAGYTDAEIAAHLAQTAGFDLSAAKGSGYSDGEVIAHLSARPKTAASQIPGQAPYVVAPAAVAPVNTAPQSLGDQIVGTGEAALATITGMTGGTVGMLGGTAQGLAQSILSGQFGTPEAANAVERAAAQGAAALTYAPRTPAGQQITQEVGEAAQGLVPLAGLAPQMQMAANAARPVTMAAGDATRASAAAAMALPQRVAAARRQPAAAVAPPAAPVAPAATVEQIAQTAKQAGDGAQRAANTLATQAAPDASIVKSAERLGVQDYLQPDHVTTSEAYRQVVGAIKSNPQSAVALAERNGLTAVAKRASDLVDEIGGTNDLSALDNTIKTRMQTTHADLLASEDGMYAQLRKEIPAKTDAPAENALAFVRQRADELRGQQNLSPLERMVAEKLAPREDGSLPSYALLDDVRKDVGAAARQQGAFRDADTGLAKRLYGEILRDQEAVAETIGRGDLFKDARAATVVRKGLEDDLSALFGKNLDRTFVAGGAVGLPGAVRSLAAGDSAKLVKLLSAVPPELRQQVVASGISTVFRKAATRGELDFTGYAKWFNGLQRNRQAYAAIMSTLPLSARKQLTALARVSQGVSDSLSARTKTGALNTIKQEMMGADTLMESLYALARRGAVAVPAEAAATAVGLPGAGLSAAVASALTKGKPKTMQAVDQLIASPEFAQLVRQRANTPQQKQAVRKVAMSKDFNKLMRAMGSQMTLSERELFIVQALQANAGMNERRDQTLQ